MTAHVAIASREAYNRLVCRGEDLWHKLISERWGSAVALCCKDRQSTMQELHCCYAMRRPVQQTTKDNIVVSSTNCRWLHIAHCCADHIMCYVNQPVLVTYKLPLTVGAPSRLLWPCAFWYLSAPSTQTAA